MDNVDWLLCPICANKTRLRIRKDTILENFPLFCPKCKQESIISVRQLNMSVIKPANRSQANKFIRTAD